MGKLEIRVERLVARPCCDHRGLTAISGPVLYRRSSGRGFTLLDVLVSMAVIMIMMSIMLPSLGRVRETAHQVICRSNVRQIGIGIAMYAEDNHDRLMHTVHVGEGSANKPWDTIGLRLEPSSLASPGNWDGLGRLYEFDYLPAPKLYYCPSHRGRNAYRDYEDQWGARSNGAIAGNFQYRGRGPMAGYLAPQTAPQTVLLSGINPASAILVDSMRSQMDFNHLTGANVLRANNSVDWYNDNNGRLVSLLPKDGEPAHAFQFENAWYRLDDDDR